MKEIERHATRLNHLQDVDEIVNAVGDAKYVLLGEASHGTSEFYRLRAEISRQLIRKKGFSFIAVEGDWPSCYSLNRFIKRWPGAAETVEDVMQEFQRWPTWMWANEEVQTLMEWMKSHNQDRTDRSQVGFYGLDVYSLWESMDEIVRYLQEIGSDAVETAKKAFACFEPYGRDSQTYGMSANYLSEDCEEQVVRLLMELRAKRHSSLHKDSESALSLDINAMVAVDAERYYRAMFHVGPESWNIRDEHMVKTLDKLMEFHGAHAKAIVWEHNTHVGDARATDMIAEGMVNVGQLLREQHAEGEVFAVGFGTHRGSVIAAPAWGDRLQTMPVPAAVNGSWEDLVHRAGAYNKLLVFSPGSTAFLQEAGHRAIGVVYDPRYERGNYVPSVMAARYDAFVHVDETHALHPLEVSRVLV